MALIIELFHHTTLKRNYTLYSRNAQFGVFFAVGERIYDKKYKTLEQAQRHFNNVKRTVWKRAKSMGG